MSSRKSPRPSVRRLSSCLSYQPRLELLEDRLAPATFHVNTLNDTAAINLVTGQDSHGDVSLRSALQAANHLGGSNSIVLGAATYTLTQGPLSVHNNLSVSGSGA